MPEHLLHLPQIGTAVQHVRGRRMAQRMGADVRYAGLSGRSVYDVTGYALVDTAASCAEEQGVGSTGLGCIRCRTGQYRPPLFKSSLQRTLGGQSERHHALLVAFAGDFDGAIGEVDVNDIHRHQFGDTDAGGIQ